MAAAPDAPVDACAQFGFCPHRWHRAQSRHNASLAKLVSRVIPVLWRFAPEQRDLVALEVKKQGGE
eukprot:232482-Pyramimonas_sp.AAC.1